MRKTTFTGPASLFVALGLSASALGMGGEGGPADAWASPYALIAPQTLRQAPGWGPPEGRSAYEGQGVAPINCHGDRACQRRMKKAAPATQ